MSRKSTTEEEFLLLFEDDLFDTLRAHQIYDALCNHIWKKEDKSFNFSWRAAGEFIANLRNEIGVEKEDPDLCQRCKKKREEHLLLPQENFITKSLRLDGRDEEADALRISFLFCEEEGRDTFLSGYSGGEDYLDYYCSGSEGKIAPWLRERFLENGWSEEEGLDIIEG